MDYDCLLIKDFQYMAVMERKFFLKINRKKFGSKRISSPMKKPTNL